MAEEVVEEFEEEFFMSRLKKLVGAKWFLKTRESARGRLAGRRIMNMRELIFMY